MGEIGEKEYRSARAALSRSVTRLEERGLVTFAVHVIIDKIRGVRLTDLGKEEARKVLVNTALNSE
jgi:Mn-dependent DtxR family transcriptional regulator